MIVVGILIFAFLVVTSFMALIKSHDPDFPVRVRDAVSKSGKVPSNKELNDGIVIARGMILLIGVFSLISALALIAK
jgi:uncharacterized protein YneF (UPF0154 family)